MKFPPCSLQLLSRVFVTSENFAFTNEPIKFCWLLDTRKSIFHLACFITPYMVLSNNKVLA